MLKRFVAIGVMTGLILAVFFAGRYWTGKILAEHWQRSLQTVPDGRAEMLVASAARLGRPGLPVLVAALGSPRKGVSSAGRLWLNRQLKSWENVSNHEAQRNVAALAEALASQLDSFDPAAKLDAARLANRLLRWKLDDKVVDRGRVIWLCDQILHSTNFVASASAPRVDETQSATALTDSRLAPLEEPEDDSAAEQRLKIPKLPLEDYVRNRIASQAGRTVTPNVVPLPSVDSQTRSTDLADAWAMQGRRLGQETSQLSDGSFYPTTRQRVLVPPASDAPPSGHEPDESIRDISLEECVRSLHDPGLTALAAESELRRRGFDELHLSIARRVHDPDRQVRLKLIRDLPGMPGVGATDWLLLMTSDEDEQVRLAAISLLATAGDPGLLAKVESIARNDSAERVRKQAARLAKRRQTLRR